MPAVRFTTSLQRHLAAPPASVSGATVRAALEEVFRDAPRLRGYVLDDQGRLRRHVQVFVDGELVRDRDRLGDPVSPTSEIYVMQALSGGSPGRSAGSSETMHVATRKGLFLLERRAAGWAVERVSFLGDPVTMVLDDRRDGTLYAALNLGHFGVKLHRSEDRGRSWTEVGAPAFPPAAEPAPAGEKAPSVHQVWALAAGGGAEKGVLWAGTIPAALFRSADRGGTWQLVSPLWDLPERREWGGGGYDEPGLHSLCVDPRDPRRIHCGISSGGVWFTADGGERWECRSSGMYAEYMPPERREDPNVQDPHHVVQCAAAPEVLWTQHHNGVFRTTDGGRRWTEVTAIRPSKFGFAVAVHPAHAETAWFVPGVKDERRVPVDGRLVVARTRDGGRSFEVLREGLPQEHAYDLVYRHGLDVDETGERLAMGSTTGNLWVSEDGGERWLQLSAHLPPVYQVAFGGAGP